MLAVLNLNISVAPNEVMWAHGHILDFGLFTNSTILHYTIYILNIVLNMYFLKYLLQLKFSVSIFFTTLFF